MTLIRHTFKTSHFILKRWNSSEFRFVDKVVIDVAGGKGGNGCVAWEMLTPGKKRASGGSGGKGGDVIIVADESVDTLNFEKFQFKGGDGRNGGSDGMTGRMGADTIIRVPLGTVVKERSLEDKNMMTFDQYEQYLEEFRKEHAEFDQLQNESKHFKGDNYIEARNKQNKIKSIDNISFNSNISNNNNNNNNNNMSNLVGMNDSNESDVHVYDDAEFIDNNDILSDTKVLLAATTAAVVAVVEQDIDRDEEILDDNDNNDNNTIFTDTNDDDVSVVSSDNNNNTTNNNIIHIDLDKHQSYIIVARGGKPGTGNSIFARSSRYRRSIPKTNMPGWPGETRQLQLELKIIADVGLVGLPNAGKSTLLSALTNAEPKIASYAFTTLHPSVGVVTYSDENTVTIADIPGLIEGAHENRGLGHEFLRHIERTHILLYVLDGTNSSYLPKRRKSSTKTTDSPPDISQVLKSLYNELKLYDERLLSKPSVLFINKADLPGFPTRLPSDIVKISKELNMKIFRGSAKTLVGMPELATHLRLLLESHQATTNTTTNTTTTTTINTTHKI